MKSELQREDSIESGATAGGGRHTAVDLWKVTRSGEFQEGRKASSRR